MSDNSRGGRAKYLRLGDGGAGGHVVEPAPGNDNAPAFTVTRGELAGLVRGAVEAALGARAPSPLLLDREGLGQALGCSESLVDKLRRRGMPSVRLGDSPRFELERCLEWLRADSKGGAA